MAEAPPCAPLVLPGDLARQFDLLRLLGKGAFATVVAARDRALDRTVALKLLHRKDTESRRRFLREAEVMAELSSPHVVSVFDSGDADGTPYMVMELVEGQVLNPNRPPANHKLVLADIADGLAQVHAAGLVHRDVKPQNVMVTREGRAVLLDLGLVRGRLDRTRLTRDGMVIGSLRYLCPEGMRGERATPAADWYALGTLAYELIEGRPPYRDEEVLARMEGELPPPPSFRRLSSDQPEARFLRALLHADPAGRRVPAELYREVLGRAVPESLEGPEPASGAFLPGGTRPAPDRSQAQQLVRRTPLGPMLALLGLGLLGALGTHLLRRGQAPPPPPTQAAEPEGQVELERVREAVDRLLEGHRDESGELHLALRGEGYDAHQVEVAEDYVDPRLPVRWRRLGERLVDLERVLGGTPEGRQRIEAVLLEDVFPALRHLMADQGMLMVVRMGSAMPGAVLPDGLRHLTREDTASIRTRMEEVVTQAAALVSSLELLRVPRTPTLVAARAELLAKDQHTDQAQIVEELIGLAQDPENTPDERTDAWLAALAALPSGFRMTTAPCKIRWQVLEGAGRWLLDGAGGSPHDQALGLARAIHAWFGTMGDCARASPETQLPLLERLVTGLEGSWTAAPAAVVQRLRWAQLVEGGLLLYGYSSTATDPAMRRLSKVLLQAAEPDDPEFARRERARLAR